MNHNNTTYVYKNDEAGLLRTFIEGSFNEDFFMDDLVLSRVGAKISFPKSNRNNKVFLKITSPSYVQQIFGEIFRDSKNIDDIKVIIDISPGSNSQSHTLSSLVRNVGGLKKAEVIIESSITHPVTISNIASYNSTLETFIFRTEQTLTYNGGSSGNDLFVNDALLTTIVLDTPNIFPITATGTFTGTPYASNGTGGTIYIPETLYSHLGDGSALDYKAATNWSTIDGYGHTTWAKIEGSVYEAT